ncbi:portal protein [Gordonia phage RobinSparkles]|nr:portal protein [Gordonia phage RobinSparkles]
MSVLLGPNGQPISSDYAKTKVKSSKKPKVGEIGGWSNLSLMKAQLLPANNHLQFDTSKLRLSDYRMMRDHYQVNSSLSLLTFMIHQVDFTVQCEDKKAAQHCEDNLRKIWTRLVRAMSISFWSGYSPNALQWENDDVAGKVMLTKIKDMLPEECSPRWKKIPAVGGTRIGLDDQLEVQNANSIRGRRTAKIFDGIKQAGYEDIPVENSFWYPLLQETGNMYGKKLLNAVFQPWFFSLLVHVFANRYYERFGEPAILARAPFDDEVTINNTKVKGNQLMQHVGSLMRSGAIGVLPNDKIQSGMENDSDYEYTLEYLESQMRGADFERYMSRLDQEISLGLFTPVLMTQTGDGGSFNLGVTHTQMYFRQINAVLADMKEYIDRYILYPMALYNFGDKVKPPEIKFRKLGATDPETIRGIITGLISGKNVTFDEIELGQELGLTIEKIEEIKEPLDVPDPNDNPDDNSAPSNKQTDPRIGKGRPERTQRPKGVDKKTKVAAGLADRIAQQYESGRDKPDTGFKARYADWFNTDLCGGFTNPGDSNRYYRELTQEVEAAFDNAKAIEIGDDAGVFFKEVITSHMDRLEHDYAG